MPQGNAELVRSMFRPGDPSRFFDLLDEDVEVDASASKLLLPDHPELMCGKDAVLDYYRHYWGAWDGYTIEPIEILGIDGDRVLVTDHQRGQGKGSGTPFEIYVTAIYTFRADKVVRLQFFNTREEALEAVGRGDDPAG